MTNSKNTKKALFSSVIALILCCSMLIGTTFAWFTDEVNSGVNQIIAGNLDVDVLTADGNSIEGVQTLFNSEDGKPIKWEPGVVAYENLTVVNKGNLALKYQLSVNFDNATKTPAGKTLAEALKVAVLDEVDTALSREELIASIEEDEWQDLASFVESGKLLPKDYTGPAVEDADKETKTYGIVIWWEPTDHDNDFNMNNENQGKVLSIDLGINLVATQLVAENDSFGNTYDEDAIYFDAIVKTDAELLAAIQDPEVTVIAIDENVTYDWGGESYENSKALLMAGKTFFGVDGDETITFAGYGSANPIVNVTLKDLTVADLTVGDNESSWEHGYLEFAGLHAENVVFKDSVMLVEAPASATTYNLRSNTADKTTVSTLINCSFNNTVSSWYALWIGGGEAIIRDCFFTGTRAIKVHEAYGSEVGTVVIDNNEFVGVSEKPGVVIGDLNAVTSISLTNNLFAGTQPGDQTNYKYESDTDVTTFNFVDENNELIEKGATTTDQLKDALTDGEDTVYLPAGKYTFPGSALSEGDVIICDEDAVFEGNSKLNINGATVIGATFSNPTGTAADQAINGTFKDCTFTGKNGLRWCYAGETVVFENCVFDGSTYGVHFDGGANEAIFRNCTFSGFNAMGGAITQLTMENCTFKANDRSNYNGINLWGNTEMIGCTFVFDGSAGTEWVDACGSNKTYVFTDCVVTDGTNETPIEEVVGNYGTGNTITVDGAPVVFSNDDLKTAITNGATKVLLREGNYDLNGIQKDGLTLIGVGGNVKMANTTKYAGGNSTGAIWKAIHLENMTITNTVYTMADGGDATFTNVYFEAGFRQGYGKNVVFTDCTFGSNSEGYALHFQTDSASEGGVIKLNGCEFEGGKVHLGSKRTYEFTNCDFATGTDFQVWSNITLDGCTVDGVEVTADNIATLFPNLNLEKVTLK